MHEWADFIKEHFSNDVPFINFMNITVEETGHGYAKIKMPLNKGLANSYGILHGGICAALTDTVIGICLRTLKMKVVTIETTTIYYAPANVTDTLYASARFVAGGKKILHAEARIENQEGQLISGGKAIYHTMGEDDGKY